MICGMRRARRRLGGRECASHLMREMWKWCEAKCEVQTLGLVRVGSRKHEMNTVRRDCVKKMRNKLKHVERETRLRHPDSGC